MKNGEEYKSSIGIIDSNKNIAIIKMLENIFVNSGYKIKVFKKNNEISCDNDNKIRIYELNSHVLKTIENMDIEILACLDISKENFIYKTDRVFNILNPDSVIILNGDNPYSMKLVEGKDEFLTITYGLNSKATFTASSLDLSNNIEFNLCLQRKIKNINGHMIEPLEFPLKLNLLGKQNVYNALVSATIALYYGIDIEIIRNFLKNIPKIKRNFEKIYDKEFNIIDNYCSTSWEYNNVFETIQHMEYNKLIIITSLCNNKGRIDYENLNILLNWTSILGDVKIIIFTEYIETQLLNHFKNILKDKNTDYQFCYSLDDSVRKSLSIVDKRDLILTIGSEEMNLISKCVNNNLKRTN